VSEESHLEDMRSAIRGDFERLAERLAERRGDQELMRVEPEPEAPAEAPPAEDVADSRSASEEQRRSWLSRFVSP
jgi:hypothetical protein